MTTQTITLKRIEPIKLGAVLGVTYCLIGFLFSIIIFFSGAFLTYRAIGWLPENSAFDALLIPIGYGVGAFVLGAVAAQIYNIVAKWTGGIEIMLETRTTSS